MFNPKWFPVSLYFNNLRCSYMSFRFLQVVESNKCCCFDTEEVVGSNPIVPTNLLSSRFHHSPKNLDKPLKMSGLCLLKSDEVIVLRIPPLLS